MLLRRAHRNYSSDQRLKAHLEVEHIMKKAYRNELGRDLLAVAIRWVLLGLLDQTSPWEGAVFDLVLFSFNAIVSHHGSGLRQYLTTYHDSEPTARDPERLLAQLLALSYRRSLTGPDMMNMAAAEPQRRLTSRPTNPISRESIQDLCDKMQSLIDELLEGTSPCVHRLLAGGILTRDIDDVLILSAPPVTNEAGEEHTATTGNAESGSARPQPTRDVEKLRMTLELWRVDFLYLVHDWHVLFWLMVLIIWTSIVISSWKLATSDLSINTKLGIGLGVIGGSVIMVGSILAASPVVPSTYRVMRQRALLRIPFLLGFWLSIGVAIWQLVISDVPQNSKILIGLLAIGGPSALVSAICILDVYRARSTARRNVKGSSNAANWVLYSWLLASLAMGIWQLVISDLPQSSKIGIGVGGIAVPILLIPIVRPLWRAWKKAHYEDERQPVGNMTQVQYAFAAPPPPPYTV
jgi:hypothetical protein